MKRRFTAAVLIAIILLLSGCRTVESLSDDELRQALRQAGELAVDNASGEILDELDTLNYLPHSIDSAIGAMVDVPGLGYLFEMWEDYAAGTFASEIGLLPDFIKYQISTLTFEYPRKMLESDTSVIDLLYSTRLVEIEAAILEVMNQKLDISSFNKALELYNDFLLTSHQLPDHEKAGTPLSIDPRAELVKAFTEFIFRKMQISEKRIRTTPDLSLDRLFVTAFSLDV